MLIPAILKKNEILAEFQKKQYTTDLMYEVGTCDNYLPNIVDEPSGGTYQYAIVNDDGKLIGYLSYFIDWYNSCAHKFGLMSFDKGNPLVGKELYNEMTKIITEYKLHRIEWRMIGGNPVERGYDRFCNMYNGHKLILRDTMKDRYGKYHDLVIYEILNTDIESVK